ncbi:hypothetical protein JTE90_022843 [Oedothorax gibbosus]|uniref:Uncharacterized protein n=1 Tax=Oedothorax gibbosus TaxID=931172 RepID=A0AAV6U4R0_9ARAC|nr:hypothetical protein JTE90_022843 [Oedothorax gibbosus]
MPYQSSKNQEVVAVRSSTSSSSDDSSHSISTGAEITRASAAGMTASARETPTLANSNSLSRDFCLHQQ